MHKGNTLQTTVSFQDSVDILLVDNAFEIADQKTGDFPVMFRGLAT